jgi:hypothetical protein
MPAPTFFASWPDYLIKGVNCASDQFVVALTNTAPNTSTNSVLADITQISYTNLSSRNLTTASATGGAVTFNDLTLTASGGSVGPFRYVVTYDDTVAGDPLVHVRDYGSSITLADTETFVIDFTGADFTVAPA